MKYQDLTSVLRPMKKIPPFQEKGMQAGKFPNKGEEQEAEKLNIQFRMVIEDWVQTPAYDMIVKGWSQNKAFLAELNQFTL